MHSQIKFFSHAPYSLYCNSKLCYSLIPIYCNCFIHTALKQLPALHLYFMSFTFIHLFFPTCLRYVAPICATCGRPILPTEVHIPAFCLSLLLKYIVKELVYSLCLLGYWPFPDSWFIFSVQGTMVTERVVSMDREYHVDCFHWHQGREYCMDCVHSHQGSLSQSKVLYYDQIPHWDHL